MLLNSLYFRLKPLIPRSIRLGVRRQLALRKLERVRDMWPIMPGSERPPKGWPGWPGGRQFAFVLTHDVEGPRGLDRVKELAELEMELGFRSSFNFVPEGAYIVPASLRTWLTNNGFEVGVHDLKHDGHLFSSQESFQRKAQRINSYLAKWNAVGFRSAYMLRNLEWMRKLDIAYDTSTFDTDPFEPQPDGVNTIFPFWVPRPSEVGDQRSEIGGRSCEPRCDHGPLTRRSDAGSINSPHEQGRCPSNAGTHVQDSTLTEPRSGYVELPYTMPQDSTLFVLLRERTNGIWRKKLDWIARHGGMALSDTHPDYLRFNGGGNLQEFPSTLYRDLLQYVNARYAGQFWHALPRQVAEFAFQHRNSLTLKRSMRRKNSYPLHASAAKKIWIDLDNTPHVPFFKPIISELGRRGFTLVLTARDAFQVCDLAAQSGLNYTKVGRHYGKNRLLKVLGLAWRSMQLLPFVLRQRPLIGLSHGSRAQILLCNLLRIPTIMVNDYEYAQTPPLVRPRWEIVPDVLFNENLHCKSRERILTYRGIKEDVYASDLRPDPSLIEQLKLNGNLIVTVRPPATEAHYHNPESEKLFVQFMNRLCNTHGAKAVLLPRNKNQETELRKHWPQWFEDSKVIIPKGAVDGLNLLWHSDLVVSGGGTMNREAAALEVPVYSIFRGKIGAVDRQLQSEGRLSLIESVEQVQRIAFRRRDKTGSPDSHPRQALRDIVDHVEEIVRTEHPGTMPSVR
jgi:predicted glycosyltransferase